MPSKRLTTLTAVAALALPLAGCSGDSGTSSPSPSASSTTPSASVSSPTPSATTPSVTPSTTPSAKPPAAKPRTAAELKKALLTLDDLPSGFAIEPPTADEGPDVTASSSKPGCSRLVAFNNAERPPGSKASADQSFSGGQDGPFVDQTLDAMGSPRAVAALQQNLRAAIRSCRSMTLTMPGEGRSTVDVREISAPRYGTGPVAVRYTAGNGPLEGLEVVTVTTGVGDVVLGITVVNGLPDDLDGATADAVDKAREVLGAAKTGT